MNGLRRGRAYVAGRKWARSIGATPDTLRSMIIETLKQRGAQVEANIMSTNALMRRLDGRPV
jgi:hypothetical protein